MWDTPLFVYDLPFRQSLKYHTSQPGLFEPICQYNWPKFHSFPSKLPFSMQLLLYFDIIRNSHRFKTPLGPASSLPFVTKCMTNKVGS